MYLISTNEAFLNENYNSIFTRFMRLIIRNYKFCKSFRHFSEVIINSRMLFDDVIHADKQKAITTLEQHEKRRSICVFEGTQPITESTKS